MARSASQQSTKAALSPDLSISARLTLWYGLTLLILLSLFAAFCYGAFHVGIHRDFDRHLEHERRELMPLVEASGTGGGLRFGSLEEASTVAYRTGGIYGTYVRLLTPEGNVAYQSPNFEGHAALPIRLPERQETQRTSREWEGKPARTHYTPLYGEGRPGEDRAGEGRAGELRGWLEVTGFEWSLHSGLNRLAWALGLGIALSLVLALGGGYVLARRTLRPVAALTRAAGQIGATNLGRRLPVPDGPRDELTRLAETFNGLIARLSASVERERRFTANAAHELLTPLTTMRSEVEVALRRDRDAPGYQEALGAVLTDAEEMTETVRGLLRLAQAERIGASASGETSTSEGSHCDGLPSEHSPAPPAPATVDLADLAREHVERFWPAAREEGIELALEAAEPAPVVADAAHLGEALSNLLSNALKYTPAGGKVTVTVERTDREARLVVRDTGVGFAPEMAEHLFGRFYRADTPEVQARPGSGLGLAIVRAIAEAYGGRAGAESEGPGRGSTFALTLPAREPRPRTRREASQRHVS